MADSNSETQRCPCGFFGTAEQNGLCSKCYREHLQRKTAEADGTAPTSTKSTLSTEHLTQALGAVGAAAKTTSSDTLQKQEKPSLPKDEKGKEDTQNSSAVAAEPSDNGEPSSSNATKRVRENSECESTGDDRPVQKNKKRCFTCNSKLQPAIREIGRCKCDLVFCQLHRLPEQHDCQYDHKENGRKEARDKMVSPKKHMGTSLKRIDSDS